MVVDYKLHLEVTAPILDSKGKVILLVRLIDYKNSNDTISLIKYIAEEL